MTALAANDLAVTYGRRRALDGVTLAVDGGTTLGIVGPNGAGNSTLLRCLAGVLQGEGTVTYEGVPLAELLREVYGVSVVCGVHPIAGVPTVDLDPSAWS